MNIKIAAKLIADFSSFINNRAMHSIVLSNKIFDRLLNLHLYIWLMEHKLVQNDDDGSLTELAHYSEMSRSTESILGSIEHYCLGSSMVSHSYFRCLNKHLNELARDSNESTRYADHLLSSFYRIFFNIIYDSPDRFSIWEHYFPASWKCTVDNLKDSQNFLCKISLNNFLEWAHERIWKESSEFDYQLNDITANIFPDVDPILWARILTFIYTPYGDDRMKAVVERPWNFGYIGRFRVYTSNSAESVERSQLSDEMKTYELAILLYHDQFTSDQLRRHIDSLNSLVYEPDSSEENKKLRMLRLFENMMNYISDRPGDIR